MAQRSRSVERELAFALVAAVGRAVAAAVAINALLILISAFVR